MTTDTRAPLRPDADAAELRAAATLIADNIECASQVRWKSDSHRDDAIRNIEAGLRRWAERLASAPSAAAPLGKYGCGCPVKRSDTVDAFCAEHCRPIDRATVPCTPEVCPEMAPPAAVERERVEAFAAKCLQRGIVIADATQIDTIPQIDFAARELAAEFLAEAPR